MSESYEFQNVDVFTVGAIGSPGQRTFYLQVRSGPEVLSLKLEKQQVAALAEYLAELLEELADREAGPAAGDLELAQPVDQAWIVGGLGVVFDADEDRFVVVAEEIVVEEEEDEDDALRLDENPHGTARFRLSPEQVAAFVTRAQSLVEAGRPTCIFCHEPIDPDGHICVRMN
ncbi:MAG: hypothetical protein JWL70_510 [Acidimicrobiia bacterium]|nr:hypothetical protein [Acidimicrobiia bacterium]